MKTKFFLILLFIVLKSELLLAQPSMDINNSADYLMITTEQQEIYLRRYLEANSELANRCQPNWNLEKSNQFFINWLTQNPQFLRRNLTSSFSTALMHSCKLLESK
jgi:hypothetical protein